MTPKRKLLGVTKAAKLLHRSRPTIYRWVEKGKLEAQYINDRTPVFTLDVLEAKCKELERA